MKPTDLDSLVEILRLEIDRLQTIAQERELTPGETKKLDLLARHQIKIASLETIPLEVNTEKPLMSWDLDELSVQSKH